MMIDSCISIDNAGELTPEVATELDSKDALYGNFFCKYLNNSLNEFSVDLLIGIFTKHE